MENSIDDLFECFDEAAEETAVNVQQNELESISITEE